MEKLLETILKNMGMSTLHRRSREYGLPLILGGAEGTLWELSGMYANLANRAQQGLDTKHGKLLQPIILKQQKAETSNQNQLSPASAWMTL